MTLGPWLRKLALTVHVTASVGWIGALAAYLALDVSTAAVHDAQTLRAAYVAMDLVATWAIVPLALAALLTGLVMALGTPWGLFRHWWALISLLLTLFAVLVLLAETQTIRRLAEIASDPATSPDALSALPSTLPHSIGGAVVLLLVTVLNVYKPRGLTSYGWRKQQEEREEAPPE